MAAHGPLCRVLVGNRNLLQSATALTAVAVVCTWYVPRAMADCQPVNPSTGGTVTCTGNQDTSYSVSNLGSLTVNVLAGANFNQPFSAASIGTLTMTTAGNLQLTTFTDITNLSLLFTGGNANQGILVSGTGNAAIVVSGGNINQRLQIDASGNHSVNNSSTINPGIRLNGGGSSLITNNAAATVNSGIASTGNSADTVNNSGTIQGNTPQGGTIDLGPGNDIVRNQANGTINGQVNTGTGEDQFFMLGGLIQGGGIFAGEGNDKAVVSGGLIQGGNYNGEAGADTFTMTGGQISGSVLHGADNDVATVSGGTITGIYGGGDGNDNLTWSGGLIGSIDMGTGTDLAKFINLTPTQLMSNVRVDGGTGPSDHLLWDNTTAGVVGRYVNWELFELTKSSELTFSSTLTLGDPGTGTGTLTIDPTSTVFAGAGGHAIVPFTPGQLAQVNNAGAIDLTNGPVAATDSLAITGNYLGQGGRLLLHTFLDTDNAPSDKLVISNGAGSGSTSILVTDVGGPGALTVANGILVVDAVNGATTTASAFTLGGVVAAGLFEYQLFRGGVTPSTETDNDWFLRNTASPPEPPSPPGPPSPPSPPRPNVRPEAPGQVIAPLVAGRMGLMTMGTFHQRRGDQSLLIGDGALMYRVPEPQGADVPAEDDRPPPAIWGRVFGAKSDLSTGANVTVANFDIAPSFDGHYWGLQAGSDVVGIEHVNGHVDRFGLFYTHAEASGDVSGNVLGRLQFDAGSLDLNEDSIAGYWTHLSPEGWYVDVVAKYAWLNGSSESNRGIGADLNGSSIAASVETGVPFVIADGWTIDPQAQLIWQRFDFDDTSDPFSKISYEAFDALTGRLGARLEHSTGALLAHLGANLWHGFSEDPSTVAFNTIPILIGNEGTWLEFNGGAAYTFNENLSAFADVTYAFDVEGSDHNLFGGQIGLKLRW